MKGGLTNRDIDAVFGFVDDKVKEDFDLEPSVENSYGEFGDYQLVGHGTVSNRYCGKWISLKGCLRVELHNKITLEGKNFKGKIFARKVHHFCNKPSCPICYKSGWAVREAGNIESRLEEGRKRFGLVEHIIVSVPSKDYGLSLENLRKKVIKVLKKRGVIGGALIFHAFRFNLVHQWFWSPHFHVLGFILGGFGKCRRCKRKPYSCRVCDGFEGRTRRAWDKDGYIVKVVLAIRKTVFGTAWYQLNHSSVKKNVRRFHVATWFGSCSYRKMKVTVERRKEVCPICQHELVKLRYFGSKCFGDVKSRGFFEDFAEDGRIVWFEDVKRKYGSGSYE